MRWWVMAMVLAMVLALVAQVWLMNAELGEVAEQTSVIDSRLEEFEKRLDSILRMNLEILELLKGSEP